MKLLLNLKWENCALVPFDSTDLTDIVYLESLCMPVYKRLINLSKVIKETFLAVAITVASVLKCPA